MSMAINPIRISRTVPAEQIDLRRLVWVGPLVVAAAVLATVLVRALALAIFEISDDFEPLASVGPTIVSTVVASLAAIGVFALVARRSQRPITTYRRVAVVALALSFIGFTTLRGTDGVGAAGIGTLIAMHLVAFAVCVGLLTTLTRAVR